jgi:iron(III)-enterobactin esterase
VLVGWRERGLGRGADGGHDGSDQSELVAAQLKAKGYHYNYLFSPGAGHTEQSVIRSFLPDAMQWLWMGYPVQE